jgi:translocon-associated protein subunit beta
MRRSSLLALLLGVLVVAAPLCRPALGSDEGGDDDDEYEDMERAHLIVRKSTPAELVVEGRKLNVTITIHNSGPV